MEAWLHTNDINRVNVVGGGDAYTNCCRMVSVEGPQSY